MDVVVHGEIERRSQSPYLRHLSTTVYFVRTNILSQVRSRSWQVHVDCSTF